MLPLKQFQCSSDWRWPPLSSFEGRSSGDSSFLFLSPPGDRWCGVVGFVQFSSVQFSSKWYLYALAKAHVRSIPYFRDFPNVAFETVRIFVWLTMALSRPFKTGRKTPTYLLLVLSNKIVEYFRFPRLSPPGDRWCDVLGTVPSDCVLSSSTLQNLRDASHLWRLLFAAVIPLHSCTSRAVHPQGYSKENVQHWHKPVTTCLLRWHSDLYQHSWTQRDGYI